MKGAAEAAKLDIERFGKHAFAIHRSLQSAIDHPFPRRPEVYEIQRAARAARQEQLDQEQRVREELCLALQEEEEETLLESDSEFDTCSDSDSESDHGLANFVHPNLPGYEPYRKPVPAPHVPKAKSIGALLAETGVDHKKHVNFQVPSNEERQTLRSPQSQSPPAVKDWTSPRSTVNPEIASVETRGVSQYKGQESFPHP